MLPALGSLNDFCLALHESDQFAVAVAAMQHVDSRRLERFARRPSTRRLLNLAALELLRQTPFAAEGVSL